MKKALLFVLCAAVVVLLAWSVMPQREDAAQENEDVLYLYYPVAEANLVSGGDAIHAVRVEWQEMRQESIQRQAEEVVRLLLGGCDDEEFRLAMPFGTKALSCKVSGSTVAVDFSSAYGQLSGMKLTMADYCVALSLVQIPGIYTVRITVNGRELAYRDRNYFHADDVLVTSPEDVVRNVAVQLYLLDNITLAMEERILTIYEGESQLQKVIEALAEGPTREGLQPLLPEGMRVLSVRAEDGVCYLNLSSDSVRALPSTAFMQRQIVIGMARSLCSVRNIREVQVLVDGEWRESFGQVTISQPFTENSK